MLKHSLFTSDKESQNFNSSRDDIDIETHSPKKKVKENTNKHPGLELDKNANPAGQSQSSEPVGREVQNEKIPHPDRIGVTNQWISRGMSIIEESDSDSMDETDFFSKGNSVTKLPYTLQEDELIIKFVLKGQNIFRTSSVSLWKHLESKKENPKRTYQSLKNRFLRTIKPKLFTTYNYLIKDDEVANNILTKFPELKRKGMKKSVFATLNLPRRVPTFDMSDEDSDSNSARIPTLNCDPVPQKQNSKEIPTVSGISSPQKQSSKDNIAHPQETNSRQRDGTVSVSESCFLRKVKLGKNTIFVTVNYSKSSSTKTSTSAPVGIYEKFSKLKSQNDLVDPCPTCSKLRPKLNRADKNVGGSVSDSDSDNFIANSVETPNKSNSKNDSENSIRVTRSSSKLQGTSKNSNSRNSVNSSCSKALKTPPKNSSAQNSASSKGANKTTTPVKSKTSNSQPSQNNSASKEQNKESPVNSNSNKYSKTVIPKDFSAKNKLLINLRSQSSKIITRSNSPKISEKRERSSSEVHSPPSRNLRKSVRKNLPNKGNIDKKIYNCKVVINKFQKNFKKTTVTPNDSNSKLNNKPYLERQTKRKIACNEDSEKPKKRKIVKKLPYKITILSHKERFILRKVLRRTYRIYKKNLLKNKKINSKVLKRRQTRKQLNKIHKKIVLQSDSESDSVSDEDLRLLYKETVSQCRKFINSEDEERPIVNQNEKESETQSTNTENEIVNEEGLEILFTASHSEPESPNLSNKITILDVNNANRSSLANNMMKMLSK